MLSNHNLLKCGMLYGQVFYMSYKVGSKINFPGSRVSYFLGNLRAGKLIKAQTKGANITRIQYFRGIWSFLRAHQQERCQLCLFVYPISITLPHNFLRIPFSPSPLSPTEYNAPLAWEGQQFFTTASPPDS